MRIGIVGSGIAGLAAAWMLSAEHDITVFEKAGYAGGHAHSIPVTIDRKTIAVDVGAQAFIPTFHVLFRRLLELTDVPLEPWPVSMAVVNEVHGRTVLLPPASRRQWLTAMRPFNLRTLLAFRRLLRAATDLVHAADWSITLESFVDELNIAPDIKTQFVWPLLTTIWTQTHANIRRSAAYSILKYLVFAAANDQAQFQTWAVKGGCSAYVERLVQLLDDVRLRCPVIAIAPQADGWRVTSAAGELAVDRLIIATSARDALPLLSGIDTVNELRHVLSAYEYFSVTIAVHGDPTFYMPPNRRDWSITNHSWGRNGHALTFWSGWQSGLPVFKSWINFADYQPKEVYAKFEYFHPIATPQHYMTQQRLAGFQGRNNLWLIGTHTYDVDSHESALISAINAVRQIDPASNNMLRLVDRRN